MVPISLHLELVPQLAMLELQALGPSLPLWWAPLLPGPEFLAAAAATSASTPLSILPKKRVLFLFFHFLCYASLHPYSTIVSPSSNRSTHFGKCAFLHVSSFIPQNILIPAQPRPASVGKRRPQRPFREQVQKRCSLLCHPFSSTSKSPSPPYALLLIRPSFSGASTASAYCVGFWLCLVLFLVVF